MNAFFAGLPAFTSALLEGSARASLVIALVVVVQWAAGKRLSPRVRYALWLLVVARLALPTSLESGVSVFNYTQPVAAGIARAANSAWEGGRRTTDNGPRTAAVAGRKSEAAGQKPEAGGRGTEVRGQRRGGRRHE